MQIDFEKFANKLFDEFYCNGKTIREWVTIIVLNDAVSRSEVIETLEKHLKDGSKNVLDADISSILDEVPGLCRQRSDEKF